MTIRRARSENWRSRLPAWTQRGNLHFGICTRTLTAPDTRRNAAETQSSGFCRNPQTRARSWLPRHTHATDTQQLPGRFSAEKPDTRQTSVVAALRAAGAPMGRGQKRHQTPSVAGPPPQTPARNATTARVHLRRPPRYAAEGNFPSPLQSTCDRCLMSPDVPPACRARV